jgi:hypothetical protein
MNRVDTKRDIKSGKGGNRGGSKRVRSVGQKPTSFVLKCLTSIFFLNTVKDVKGSRFISMTVYAGFEMSRISHCLGKWITDGGEFVSPANRPLSTSETFSLPGTEFC